MTAISRDEHWLVTATSHIDLDALPGTAESASVEILRWDLTATDVASTKSLVGTHAGQLGEICITANSDSVVHGSWDGSITYWSLEAPAPKPQPLDTYPGDVLALTAAGDYLAFGGSVDADLVEEDSSRAGQCYAMVSRNLSEPQQLPFGHQAPIDFMKFDALGHWLLTAAEESALHIWDMQTSPITTPRLASSSHVSPVQDAWFAENAREVVTCKLNGTIEFWDMESTHNPGPLVLAERLPSATSVTVTPNGKWLVCCGSEGVWIWNYARCWLLKKASDQLNLPLPTNSSDEPRRSENVES
jgi:WD40 repeat protein